MKNKFLAWSLVCVIFFQSLMPAFSIIPAAAAAADTGSDSGLTFNGGYPYGKDMTKDSVTLVAPVEGSGRIQWYQSTARDGEYTPISGATGKEYKPNFNDKSCYPDGPSSAEYTQTFRAYDNGTLDPAKCPKNWYRCTVNGVWSKPVQLVQAVQLTCYAECNIYTGIGGKLHIHSISEARSKLYQIAAIYVKNAPRNPSEHTPPGTTNTYWYISNGYAAYTVYPKGEAYQGTYRTFDVLGRYKNRNNANYYWLGEDSVANMSFDTNSYSALRMRFDDDDEYQKRVLVDIDLPDTLDRIALVFTPKLGEYKMFNTKLTATNGSTVYEPYTTQSSGLISAIFKNRAWMPSGATAQDLTGIQMMGSTSATSGIKRDTPAWNITFEDDCKPSYFWLGNEGSELYKKREIWDKENHQTIYDPAQYVYDFNTKKSANTKDVAETAELTVAGGKAITSVRCIPHKIDSYYVEYTGSVAVDPHAAISWTGKAGQTVTFGIAAGNVIDTKAACTPPGKCPVYIGGKPVIWMPQAADDAHSGDGYTYDGEPIELLKDKTTVETANEVSFTTAEVRSLLNVVTDLEYTFYEAEGERTKNPNTLYKGQKLDGIPIDSRDYFLTVSVPKNNPYFTGSTDFYFNIFAKPIPVYNVTAKDRYYNGTKTVRWDLSHPKWGDDTEEHKVYDRDHVDTWWIEKIEAEFKDAQIETNKQIVGLNGEEINIIHWSDPSMRDNQWRNYVPYLSPTPTASILFAQAGAEDALDPPEKERITATRITLKTFPTDGTVEYAMKIPDPGLTDAAAIAADLAAAPTDGWQTSPEFSGLEKDTEYYFYLRLTGDTHFEDPVVTSKGAAISTISTVTEVELQNPVTPPTIQYTGSPVEPQLKFKTGSPTCPEEAVTYTWIESVYDSATNQFNDIELDGPPKKISYRYKVKVSIKPEYAQDYAIKGTDTFSFYIAEKYLSLSSTELFQADDRDYDGTANATIHYDEDALRAAIEVQMLPGETTAGMIVAAVGRFGSDGRITAQQAYSNKNVYVTVTMSGPGAENYYLIANGSLKATIRKAGRTIAAPEIEESGEDGVTLAAPAAEGVDDTAGTDGTVSYAVSRTDTAPAAASAWQTSPVFSGLASDGMGYYFFARITGGTNYEDAVSPGTLYYLGAPHDHNWDSANWTFDDTGHWHKCLTAGCPVRENSKKDGYGPHNFGEWEEDTVNGGRFRACRVCGYRETVHTPSSQISMGTWTWTRLHHTQDSELLFSMKEPTLQIFAADSGKDLIRLDYACTAAPSDPEQLAETAWQPLITDGGPFGTFTDHITVPEELRSGVYVYARTMDAAGGVCYSSTPRLVFDTEAPEIKNGGASVASGCTYCTPQTVAVSDHLGLERVTLDGTDVTASAGAIRLEAGKHSIVATDRAGNSTAVTVQVNNGHTNREWSIPASCDGIGITITTCTVCGYTTTTPEPAAGHAWGTEPAVDQEPTCTEPGIQSLHCTKCGAVKDVQELPAAGHTLEEGWHTGASHHWKVCSVCGERVHETSHQSSGLWEPEPGQPAGEGVTEYMKCAVCGAVLAQRYRPNLSEDPDDPRYGSVEKQIEVKPGAPEAQWENSLGEVLTAVGLSKEDLTDHHNAVSHKLVLSVSPFGEETIPGQTEIEEKAETVLNRTDAQFLYVDVSLTRHTYVEGETGIAETTQPIKTTREPIEVMLQIPEELQTPPKGMNRTFYLLYAHTLDDGTVESSVLEAGGNSGDGRLYFSTSRFSTYAIAYIDTPEGEKPPVITPPTPTSPSSSGSGSGSSSYQTVDHICYIYGYEGQFRPDEPISRAEAAQIFYRLLADTPQTGLDFDDVPETAWYREPVSALAGLGIVQGIGDSRFDPQRPVTRAEFAAMAARFMDVPPSKEQSAFSDIPDGAWYGGFVSACKSAGWIKGYPDGLFHPTDAITRAQAVTIVNSITKRSVDKQVLEQRTMPFSDIPRTHWAYDDILEAAVAHKATLQSNGREIWK